MGKYSYSSIAELENDIKAGINVALKEVVGISIATMLINNAQEVVYEGYDPTVYDYEIGDRRYSLTQPGNYNIQLDGDMKLSVTPEAEFNPNIYIFNPYAKKWIQKSSSNSGNELAGLINYGDGWNGYHYDFQDDGDGDGDYSSYSAPRPFIDITKTELEGGMAKELLAESLRQLGYPVS